MKLAKRPTSLTQAFPGKQSLESGQRVAKFIIHRTAANLLTDIEDLFRTLGTLWQPTCIPNGEKIRPRQEF